MPLDMIETILENSPNSAMCTQLLQRRSPLASKRNPSPEEKATLAQLDSELTRYHEALLQELPSEEAREEMRYFVREMTLDMDRGTLLTLLRNGETLTEEETLALNRMTAELNALARFWPCNREEDPVSLTA